MKQITLAFLQCQVDRLNRATNNPLASYTQNDDGKHKANIGNYHLDGAYGGYALHQMLSEGGGVRDVFRSGHLTKRELSNRISAYLAGIESTQ